MTTLEEAVKAISKKSFCSNCGLKHGAIGFPECYGKDRESNVSHHHVIDQEDVYALLSTFAKKVQEEEREKIYNLAKKHTG